MSTTQVQQDNVALVRRGFEAFNAGDMATLTELFASDATYHSAPLGVLGGNHVGRDQIFAVFGQLARETGGTFRSTPRSFAATGDQVFVQALATGTRNGHSIEIDEVLVFTIAGGKVRDVSLYLRDYPASLAFWS